MELSLCTLADIPLWLVLFLGCFWLLYKYGTRSYNVWTSQGIDGPKPIPFFGNALTFFKMGNRLVFTKWQERYGKVVGFYIYGRPALMVSDPDMLKEIFVKQFQNVTDRSDVGSINRILKAGVFFANGSDWHRIRRIMNPNFSSSKLKQLVGQLNRNSHRLAENAYHAAEDGCRLNAKDLFGAFSLDAIAAATFGLDINSQSDSNLSFIKQANNLLTFKTMAFLKIFLASTVPPITSLYRLLDIGFFDSVSCAFFEKSVYNIIAERKGKPDEADSNQPDFLQFLLNAEADMEDTTKERKLTLNEIVSQCIIFIIAGYETTSATLQYISYELARNTAIQDKLWEEIKNVVGDKGNPSYDEVQKLKFMSAVIHETLRMYPPSHLINRLVTKACVVGGVELPVNTEIMIPVVNVGRDPELFEEPDVFKPERFLQDKTQTMHDVTFLPFGFGPRHCIGLRLAMLELKIALVHLLSRVIVVDATPNKLEYEDVAIILAPKVPIQLTFEERSKGVLFIDNATRHCN